MKNISKIIAVSISGLVVAGIAFAWNNPSGAPPTGNGAISVDSSGNVGIGILSPTTKLDVSGIVKLTGLHLPTGAVNNYVLTSDASGIASWKSVPSQTHGMQMLNYAGSSDQYSGTFTVPAGVTQLFVQVYGGGGGGGSKYNGYSGYSSSFSSLSATSGEKGDGTASPAKGGLGGVGSGGSVNIKGGAGENETLDYGYDSSFGSVLKYAFSGNGGSNLLGAGGRSGNSAGVKGEAGNTCGGGGGGGPGGGTGTAFEKTGAGGGAGGVAMGWISATPGSSISYKIGRGGWGGDTLDSSSLLSGGKGCIVVSW